MWAQMCRWLSRNGFYLVILAAFLTIVCEPYVRLWIIATRYPALYNKAINLKTDNTDIFSDPRLLIQIVAFLLVVAAILLYRDREQMRREMKESAHAEIERVVRSEGIRDVIQSTIAKQIAEIGEQQIIALVKDIMRRETETLREEARAEVAQKAKEEREGLEKVYKEKLEDLKKVVPSQEDAVDSLRSQAEAEYDKGNFDSAIFFIRRYMERNPGSARAHYVLALALDAKGDLVGATTAYRETLAINPKLAQVHNNLGVALFQSGKTKEAINSYNEAIRASPKLKEAYSNLGNALLKLGDPKGAIKAHEAAIEIDDKYAPAYNNLGTALLKDGDSKGAETAFIKAIDRSTNLPEPRYNLARVYARSGDVVNACHWLEAAITFNGAYRKKARNDPDFGPIRDRPEFLRLINE